MHLASLPLVHLAPVPVSLVCHPPPPDNRCQQEGAARQERVTSGARVRKVKADVTPRNFHTENVTLYF